MPIAVRESLKSLLIVSMGGLPMAAQLLAPSPASTRPRQSWEVRQFTYVKRVPREAGAPANDQPLQVAPETLRLRLAEVQLGSSGDPLFVKGDLADLVKPLSQALKVAGPGDDLVLLSNRTREGGILNGPTAITARLFIQGGSLNLIVHDARLDFYTRYLGNKQEPEFQFGSRNRAGSAQVQCAGATSLRADWLAIPLQSSPAAVVPKANPGAPVAGAPVPVAPAPAAAPAVPHDEAFYKDQEERMKVLKRMRAEDLISEEEYQQKRQAVLGNF